MWLSAQSWTLPPYHSMFSFLNPNHDYFVVETGYLADKLAPRPQIESTLWWVPEFLCSLCKRLHLKARIEKISLVLYFSIIKWFPALSFLILLVAELFRIAEDWWVRIPLLHRKSQGLKRVDKLKNTIGIVEKITPVIVLAYWGLSWTELGREGAAKWLGEDIFIILKLLLGSLTFN